MRTPPIQVLLGVVLIAMTAVLLAVYALMNRESELRAEYETLNDQRYGVSLVLFGISDRADQLQRLARLAASSGEINFVNQHKQLRETLTGFRAQLAQTATMESAFPDLFDNDLREWMSALRQAALSEAELTRLRSLLDMVLEWSRDQASAIGTLVPGLPDEVILLHLTSAAQELANWRSGELVEDLEFAVTQRLSQQGDDLRARIIALQQWQTIMLGVLMLTVLGGFSAFQRFAVRPLRQVLSTATRIGAGNYELRIQPQGVRETRDLALTLNWMADAFEADILARLDAEERAREAEARVREVGDLAPGAVWAARYTRPRGFQVLHTSRGFNHLYALGGEALAKNIQTLFRCIHPEDREPTRAAIVASMSGGRDLQIEHRTLRPDGEYRWTRVLARVTHAKDATISWNGFCMDMHELKLLRQSTEDALRRAQAANEAKSAFLANVSHEVRTPLNAIIGITDLALAENQPPSLQRKFQRIGDAGRNLLGLLNDVLDSSKLDAGRMTLHAEDFHLASVLQSVLDLHADTARRKRLDIQLQIDPGTPLALHGDAMRLQQALGNLLSNAIKFTASGHVTLQARRATEAPRNDSVWVRFEVSDTGRGIPQEQIPGLFEPFTQADSSISRHYGGTGLGLTIVRQLVELLGGEVGVRSESDVGSTFSLQLPFAPAHQPHAVQAPMSKIPPPTPTVRADDPVRQLSTVQRTELMALVRAGDTRARECLRQWFGEELPASLQGLQQDLDAFEFERAAEWLAQTAEADT